MRSDRQVDAFNGVFDDASTGVRIKVIAGVVVATVSRNAITDSKELRMLGMSDPFGEHGAPPRNFPTKRTSP